MCAQCTSQAPSAKLLTTRVQGPLKGPGGSRILDALSCYLSLILKHSDTKRDWKKYSRSNFRGDACLLRPPMDPPLTLMIIFFSTKSEQYYPFNLIEKHYSFNPKKTGGGPKRPPLDILRDHSATRKALAATLYDFFLSSFPHILTPNLWRPGVRFWSYITFCTCTSDRKWLQNVILCTKSMQIEFFHIVHINMLICTLNGWNEFVLALLCFKKCLPQISPKKTTKTKSPKTKKYIRNS